MRISWLILLAACGGAPTLDDVEAGDYQFYTLAVDDGCLDGALEVLFMPEGPTSRHAFEFPIYVPSIQDTPLSYDVDFRAPFLGMPVTVEANETNLLIRGSVMDAVQLDAVQYGDCVATMAVDADLWPTDGAVLGGEARIDISNPRGSENRCPVLDADPCLVGLDIEAERLGAGSPE